MKYLRFAPVLLALLCTFAVDAGADDRGELLELKNTILNLVDALVEEGILSAEKASTLKADAAARARAATAVETESAPAADTEHGKQGGSRVVRVPYVPEFVKDEIREQVREELRADVAKDVIATAKEERWGVKDALPGWVNALTWGGDFRVRYEGNYFADGNVLNPNFQAINEAGGLTPAGINAFRNVSEDRHRLRIRARIELSAKILDEFGVAFRFATGSLDNPVSTNSTLGDFGDPVQFNVDRAWMHWDKTNRDGFNWLSAVAGRVPNPYYRPSEILWDNDLTFEGLAATLRQPLGFMDNVAGPASPVRHAFLTVGAFPLEEAEIAVADSSSNDKWLWGVQAGLDFAFNDTSAMTLSFAYYDYINIVGRRNTFNSRLNDWTAPALLDKGNTLFDIRNDLDLNTELFALASDYSIANLSAQYRYSGISWFDVWLTADVVKNLAYSESDILRRTGASVSERSFGYWAGVELGTVCEEIDPGSHCVDRAGEWHIFGGYRYLQRDAVLDTFTASFFHLGGTDMKGYMLGFEYGIARNTWMRLRYTSADEIDGPPLGIDVLQVDMNTRF